MLNYYCIWAQTFNYNMHAITMLILLRILWNSSYLCISSLLYLATNISWHVVYAINSNLYNLLLLQTVYCKSFDMEKFHYCRIELYFTGKHSQLHGIVLCGQILLPRGIVAVLPEKVLGLPINPRKLWNLSTSNNLQYTVIVCYRFVQFSFLSNPDKQSLHLPYWIILVVAYV